MLLLLLFLTITFGTCDCYHNNNPYAICTEDQTVVAVVDDENNDPNRSWSELNNQNRTIIKCKNLTTALSYVANNMCIVIKDREELPESRAWINIYNLTIGSIDNSIVQCPTSNTTNGTGLSFSNSGNIIFINVVFKFCGAYRIITNGNFEEEEEYMIQTTLFFEKTINLNFTNVIFLNHVGLAITLINAGGSTYFGKVIVKSTMNTKSRQSSGVFLRYTGEENAFDSFNKIQLYSTWFINLVALLAPGLNKGEVHSTSYPFGVGAFSVIFENSNCINNEINIVASHFIGNNAGFGGAIFVRMDGGSSNNRISILGNTEFKNNEASKFGGAICIISKNNDSNNIIHLDVVKFENNKGRVGGAIFSWHPVNALSSINVTLSGCTFISNSATIGSDLLGVHTTVYFMNRATEFQGNQVYTQEQQIDPVKSFGSISLYSSAIRVMIDVILSKSLNSAIVLVRSKCHIFKNLTLSHNKGRNGGGIIMYSQSKIYVDSNALLSFKNNQAEGKGGGLYATAFQVGEDRDNIMKHDLNGCFLTAAPNSTVLFKGNIAMRDSGSAIYASSLKKCTKQVNWHLDKNQTIITDPASIQVYESQWKIEPGKTFQPNISLNDEQGNPVTATLDFVLNNACCSKAGINVVHKHAVINDHKTSIAFTGDPFISCMFDIHLIASGTVSKTIANRTLSNCSKFYELKDQRCRCRDEGYEPELHISHCFQDKIYVYLNYWYPEETNTPLKCPHQYCKELNDSIETINDYETNNRKDILFDQKNQCNKHRDQSSKLCSKCKEGYAVSVTNDLCIQCNGAWYKWTIYFIVVILWFTLLDFGIIFLNRRIYAGYINPVIYSYNLLKYFLVDIPNLRLDPLTNHLQGYLLPRVCVFEDLNNLDKMWLDFLFTLFPFLCYMLNYWMFYKMKLLGCVQSIPRSRDAYHRSLTSIVFLTYFNVVRFSFRVLHWEHISGKLWVRYYAEELYCSEKHTILVVLSTIWLLILFVYNLLLLVNSTSIQDRLGFNMVFSSTTQPVMMALKSGYKTSKNFLEDRTWFAPIYMNIFTLYIALAEYYTKTARLCLLTMVGLLMLLLSITLLPYKSRRTTLMECVLLGNIVVVGVVIDGVAGMFFDAHVFEMVLCICCYLPGVCLVGFILYSLLLKDMIRKVRLSQFFSSTTGCFSERRRLQKVEFVVPPPFAHAHK